MTPSAPKQKGDAAVLGETSVGECCSTAVNMVVNGFCKDVFQKLSMEYAVEAQKLLGVSLEGSVG